MVFSSEIFLFLFLPIVFIAHYFFGRKAWNLVLLIASLIFYTWGEQAYVMIMIYSIVISYIVGLLLERPSFLTRKKQILAIGVVMNLLPLIYFKYSGFFLDNVNGLLENIQAAPIIIEAVSLPIGISFFTFQAISYLIDISRGEAKAQRSILNLGLYISLFPQLIAGPIVRYHDINKQITNRSITLENLASGSERFIIGLAKKVLIANTIGEFVDSVFGLNPSEINAGLAWLAIVGYSLQIYFDFSGYSDMAIGLCRMFGFNIKENFNYPYSANSIKDFWRRWHISLSSWFRDYLYIPLGGNRLGASRTIVNLFVVFFLCGLWHGASWNFIAWGLFHGLLLSIERISSVDRLLTQLPKIMTHSYTLLMILFGWVLFRAPTLEYAMDYYVAMFSFNRELFMNVYLLNKINNELYIALAFGILFSIPSYPFIKRHYQALIQKLPSRESTIISTSTQLLFTICIISLVLLSIIATISGNYNPFLYFRF